MKILIHPSHDPHYNLALEEYLFDTVQDDLFMLWQNGPSVIIGKNQNAYTEVNLRYTEQHGIPVVRRMTGGGAVYHDLGNVNYTFLSCSKNGEKGFLYFTRPIVDALRGMGADVAFSGRNDITTATGEKISGNARWEKNGRIMHHGTLLYDSDLSVLEKALLVHPDKMKSKGIESVKSRVTNIRQLISEPLSTAQFMDRLLESVIRQLPGDRLTLTDEDRRKIGTLTAQKYATDSWNLSVALPFDIRTNHYFPYGLVEIGLTVKAGIIHALSITGDFFGVRDIDDLSCALTGLPYQKDAVIDALMSAHLETYIAGATPDDLAPLFFPAG